MKLQLKDDDSKQQENTLTVIRRVDLIVTPPEQYPFALLSWTGSKVPTTNMLLSALPIGIV